MKTEAFLNDYPTIVSAPELKVKQLLFRIINKMYKKYIKLPNSLKKATL